MRKYTYAFLLTSLLASGTASALSFGDDINITYNCNNAGGQCAGVPGGLTASATFTFFNGDLTGNPANSFYLRISFSNTSTYASNLTSIAFDFPFALASINQFVGDATWGFDGYQVDTASGLNFPGGLRLDACAETDQGGQCGGGLAAGGLYSPANPVQGPATVYFGFNLATGVTGQQFLDAFEPFATCVRFQTVGPTGNDSGVACGGRRPPDVPEPGTLALLGLGLLGLGVVRRRQS